MTNQEKIKNLDKRFAQIAIKHYELEETIRKAEKELEIKDPIDLNDITNDELFEYTKLLKSISKLQTINKVKDDFEPIKEKMKDLFDDIFKNIIDCDNDCGHCTKYD